MCERKKKEEAEEWAKEAREAKTEGKMWKIVNRERRKRRRMNEGISAKKWREYFMGLLGEIGGRVVGGRGEMRRKR